MKMFILIVITLYQSTNVSCSNTSNTCKKKEALQVRRGEIVHVSLHVGTKYFVNIILMWFGYLSFGGTIS